MLGRHTSSCSICHGVENIGNTIGREYTRVGHLEAGFSSSVSHPICVIKARSRRGHFLQSNIPPNLGSPGNEHYQPFAVPNAICASRYLEKIQGHVEITRVWLLRCCPLRYARNNKETSW